MDEDAMMIFRVIHLIAFAVSLALGLMVFMQHRERRANQCFLLLTASLSLWLALMMNAFQSATAEAALFFIRATNGAAVFIPYLFNCLRLAISRPDDSLKKLILHNPVLLISSIIMSGFCHTPLFIHDVEMPADPLFMVPIPHYGPAVAFYGLYFISTLFLLIGSYIRDLRAAVGLKKIELQFIMLSWAVGTVVGILLSIIIPLLTGFSQSVQFLPVAAICILGIIAYGIATRRIMAVAEVLRRATAYALLTAYLVAIYLATWGLFRWGLQPLEWHNIAAHVIATLAVAFSIAPAQGRFQQVAARLFLTGHSIDATRTMQQANRIISVISTRDELLRQFADLVASSAGADKVCIYLKEESFFVQKHPLCDGDSLIIEDGSPLARFLAESREPLSADYFHRHRAKPHERQACEQITALRASLAIGIHADEELRGIVLLGPTLSGHIYGATEQSVLQVLCDQLAVGVQNADLYTQVKDSSIYNDLLLDNVVTGIIAANRDGRITTCNREAHRLLDAAPGSLLQQPLDVLPAPLAHALRATLSTANGTRGVETTLKLNARGERPVRFSTAPFASHTGKQLGALLVIEDLTAIRKLETQIRRTDRLASIGTLSAGMAHEIKNPLVTLKTFTQLLPERYQDADFRDTFSSLVGQEVKRIDSIVNQLLRFARPAKPSLLPTHIHEVLDNTLRLVHQQLKQKQIQLVRDYQAPSDLIQGDNDLLVQAFLNFFLNAIDAMSGGGTLTVRTEFVDMETHQLTLEGGIATETRLRVAVQDDGVGIRPEDIPHVFDPFFTTKSTGTGLGLSVSHGIIHEHGGVIDVESKLGRGSTFYILFPTATAEVEA